MEKRRYYRNGKASRNVNDRIRRKHNDSTSIAEQIEKLTVQLQKVEAEKQTLQEAALQEVIVKQRMEELKNELQNSLQQKMKQK